MPAVHMRMPSVLGLLVAALALVVPRANALAVSEATSATCSALGQISYWAATAHLSEADKRLLAQVRSDALQPNKLRKAVPKSLVQAAELAGVMSHGNAGEGNTSLQAARQDAVLTALDVHSQCVAGTFGHKEVAGWTSIGRSAGAAVLYDKASVRRVGNSLTVWVLSNFSTPEVIDGKSHRSAKAKFEYECRAERYRVLGTIYYADAGGQGKVTGSTSLVEAWNPVAPRTMAEDLMKELCAA